MPQLRSSTTYLPLRIVLAGLRRENIHTSRLIFSICLISRIYCPSSDMSWLMCAMYSLILSDSGMS